MKTIILNLVSVFLFLVAISMFIPTPSSTEENYEVPGLYIAVQIALFAVSRTLVIRKNLWWVALLEVFSFAMVAVVFQLSYNIILGEL